MKNAKAKGPKLDKKFSLDRLFRETTRNLIRDFQDNLQDSLFCTDVLAALNSGASAEIRRSKPQMDFTADTHEFKCAYQVASIDKRYRYSKDIYSDNELQDMAVAKFLDVQSRLKNLDWSRIDQDERLKTILRGARALVHHVLGEFSDAELRRRARFGPGASVGVLAAHANLAERFVFPISGTESQITWWKSEYDDCPHFQEWSAAPHAWRDYGSDKKYEVTETLKLTFVPKSYKSLRAILANTTIGSYQSGGIGEMIRLRLKQKLNLDIQRCQSKHHQLSQEESIIQKHCTVDLQSASDSLSVNLVQRLLPKEWFDAINIGCCRKVALPSGEIVEVETFSTMGIGCTFTLQTLIFYSLIWAVRAVDELLPQPRELRVCKTLISVFGDDLIFGVVHYKEVKRVLEELGIVVNDEKSFFDVPFRESCGGDYYRGRNVRPFQPEVPHTSCLKIEYEAILYKFINGLTQRWEEYEIWRTLQFLVAEVESVSAVKLVSLNMPEDSGVRITGNKSTGSIEIPEFLRSARYVRPKSLGHGLYRFPVLTKKSKRKEELRHGPYYWSVLRGEALYNPSGFVKEYNFERSSNPFPVASHLALLWVAEMADRPPVLTQREYWSQTSPYDNDLPLGPHRGDSPPCGLYDNITWKKVVDQTTIPHTAKYTRQMRTSEFRSRS